MTNVKRSIICMIIIVLCVTPFVFAGGQEEGVEGPRTLTIMGGTHLRNVLTGDQVGHRGENVLERFEEEFNATVNWQESPTGDQADAINRLGPLPRTEEDLIFFTGLYPAPRVAPFFYDLSSYVDAIEDYPGDFSPGMIEALTIDGKLIGMPYRAGTFSLWYNEAIFEERGIAGPPKTPEELYEIAKQTTYVDDNGQQIFGVMNRGTTWDLQEQLALWARMWDDDPVSMDFQAQLTSDGVINAVELWQRMYREGILPGDWATMSGSEVMQHFKDGRVAMIMEGTNYWPRFNEADDSLIRGDANVAHMPLAEELWTAERDFNPSFFWFWSVGILNGSQNKDLAWDFIEFTARPEIQREMALNENGPPRISTLEFQVDFDPGAAFVAEQMPFARVALPAHDNIGEIIDTMGVAVHDVVVDGQPARERMERAQQRVQQLLDQQ